MTRWCVLIITLLCCATAAAQRTPPVEIVRVEFGFNNSLAVERWTPVRVWLTSKDKPFSGMLSVRYAQDATQDSQVVIPVSTQPDDLIPFEVGVAVPQNCVRIDVEVTDGRRGTRRTFDLSNPGLTAMPTLFSSTFVLTVGTTTAGTAFDTFAVPEPVSEGDADAPPPPAPPPQKVWTGAPIVDNSTAEEKLWARMEDQRAAPADLPRGWMLYEFAEVVIGRADDLRQADPRSLDALMTWVEAGGRLIVQVDDAGDVWRRFLGDEGDVVHIADQAVVVADGSLAQLASTGRTEAAKTITFKARLMSMTDKGRRDGWTLAWLADTASSPADGAQPRSAGLIATGPVGMGMVTLLGVEPERMPPVLSSRGTQALWRQVIEGALPRHVREAAEAQQYAWYWGPSASDPGTAAALTNAMDRVTVTPPAQGTTFVVIAVCLLALSFMIGPGDWLLLRRRRALHRSWLTSFGWIASASIIAWLAPTLVRSGTSTIRRFEAVDTICDTHGVPVRAWKTGITGVFGGRPTTFRLGEAESPVGAWWRGISALHSYESMGRTFSPLLLPIQSADTGGYVLGATPPRVSVGQWTFRTLMDQRPGRGTAPDDIGARVRRAGDGWEVTLVNVPAGVNAAECTLEARGRTYLVTLEPTGDGELRGTCEADVPAERLTGWSPRAEYDRQNNYAYVRADGRNFGLPMFRARTEAADARTAGDYAQLRVWLTELPAGIDVQPSDDLTTTRCAALRILTPLKDPEDRP